MISRVDTRDEHRLFRLLCLILFAGTVLCYAPVFRCDFITLDDEDYVTGNWHVTGGLTWENIAWAFTAFHSFNWHPVTWISHMLDVAVFGLRPAGHHATNLLLHVANALLLFRILFEMTRSRLEVLVSRSNAIWRSAAVAALFAWHPIHVESVAWISERKDVLSMFFGLLAIWAYARHANRTNNAQSKTGSNSQRFVVGYYFLSLFFFALALMSKPMLVTLPFVFLLLDYWPLKPTQRWPVLFLEKIPFLLLTAASCLLTVAAQEHGGSFASLQMLSLTSRLQNSFIAYAAYIGKIFCPTGLAVFYPMPTARSIGQTTGAALLLVLLTLVAIVWRRRRPYLIVGWLWFLGTLIPVIGLVQVGMQAIADRYMYLPSIGFFVAVVWALGDFAKKGSRRIQLLLKSAIAIALGACTVLTVIQASYWRNSLVLFTHAQKVTRDNFMIRLNLGVLFANSGRLDEAYEQYRIALEHKPGDPLALYDAGLLFLKGNNFAAAIECFQSTINSKPGFGPAHYNLARALSQAGRFDEAIVHYDECLRRGTVHSDVHYNFANALVSVGRFQEAVDHYKRSLSLGESADAHNNLGAVLAGMGNFTDAATEFQAALRLKRNFPEAEDQLAAALERAGQMEDARRHYEQVVALKPESLHAHLKLGLILAQQGKFNEARPHLEKAIALQPTNDVAFYNLGALFAAQSDFTNAASAFRKVIELNPKDADAHARLATVYMKWQRTNDARTHYREAIELMATQDQACATAGRFADAIKIAERAEKLAIESSQNVLAEKARQRLESYRQGKVFRDVNK